MGITLLLLTASFMVLSFNVNRHFKNLLKDESRRIKAIYLAFIICCMIWLAAFIILKTWDTDKDKSEAVFFWTYNVSCIFCYMTPHWLIMGLNLSCFYQQEQLMSQSIAPDHRRTGRLISSDESSVSEE